MPDVPKWSVKGDWFDTCKCSIPCPCYFAQPPTYGDCEGVLAWHIREGSYGGVILAGLNVMALGAFTGNVWAGATATMGIFIDERANEGQREALQMIFGGRAGGWPGLFAKLIAEVRGIEYVPIQFEVADDLASWRAEIPGKVIASAEALSGPTSLPRVRKLVQAPSPRRARRQPIEPRPLVSNGTGRAVPASTCDLTGQALTRSERLLSGFRFQATMR
jgi:hypothetical protein